MQKRKGIIKKLLDDYKTDVKQDKLLDEFTSCQVALHYERIFAYIFKSQLNALKELNSSKNGVPRNEFMRFYIKAKEENPQEYANTSFETWVSFLVINNFIQQREDYFYSTSESIVFVDYVTVQRGYNVQWKKF